MAAPSRKCLCTTSPTFVIIWRNLRLTSLFRDPISAKDSPAPPDSSSKSETNSVFAVTENEINSSQDDIENIRDISRMPKRYRDHMLHALTPPPPLDYIEDMHRTDFRRRQLYGKYGRQSGIDPGIMWPSLDKELPEIMEYEKEWEPSLQERWKKSADEKAAEAEERRKKSEHVAKQMAKMPEIINQYRARLAKVEELEQEQERKRQVLAEEARDFFGYDLDRSDPRFEQMALAKEEEEKTKKKKKKEEKLQKLANFIKHG